MLQLNLSRTIGPDDENDTDDVASTAVALTALGISGAGNAAETGEWDEHFDESIRTYQDVRGLDVDGILLPTGPTETAINSDLGTKPVSPKQSSLANTDLHPEGQANRARGRSVGTSFGLFESPREHRQPPNPFALAREKVGSPTTFDMYSNDSNELPRISDRAARTLAQAQQRDAHAQTAIAALGLLQPEQVREANDDGSILASLGYRYKPDPMGRLGWGDWVDASGQQLDPGEKRRLISSTTRAQSLTRSATSSALDSSQSRTRRTTFDALENDLTEIGRLPIGLRVSARLQLALPSDGSSPAPSSAMRARLESANTAIRETTARMALDGERIAPQDIVGILGILNLGESHRGPPNTMRIRDLLMNSAYSPSAETEKRHNAQAMLVVHDEAMRDAFSRGLGNPERFADRALANFLAEDAGDVSWRVTVPGEDGDGADATTGEYVPSDDDDSSIEPVGDDQAGKPRGSRNPITREAAREGLDVHRDFTERHRPREQTENWKINRRVEGEDGKRYQPDARQPGKVIVEVKPDTPSGRRAAEKAKEKYERGLNERVRILYHKGRKGGSGPGSGGSAPPGSGPASGGNPAPSGSRASPPSYNRAGVGSTRIPVVKGFQPPSFGRWPPLRK